MLYERTAYITFPTFAVLDISAFSKYAFATKLLPRCNRPPFPLGLWASSLLQRGILGWIFNLAVGEARSLVIDNY